MNKATRLPRLITALALGSLLAACGGGGDSSASTSSIPEDGKLVLNEGTSATPAATYTIDASAGDTGVIGSGAEAIEYAYSYDVGDKFQVAVAFQQTDPTNFAVTFDDDSADEFICSGKQLTAQQVIALNNALGTNYKTIPVCPSGISINAAQHRLQASNVRMTAPSGKSIVISANVGWKLN